MYGLVVKSEGYGPFAPPLPPFSRLYTQISAYSYGVRCSYTKSRDLIPRLIHNTQLRGYMKSKLALFVLEYRLYYISRVENLTCMDSERLFDETFWSRVARPLLAQA